MSNDRQKLPINDSNRVEYKQKDGVGKLLMFDGDNVDLSWLDQECDNSNESKDQNDNNITMDRDLNSEQHSTKESDPLLSLEAFRRELDDITKSFDVDTDLADVCSPNSYFSSEYVTTKDSNEKRQWQQGILSPLQDSMEDGSLPRSYTPSNIYTASTRLPAKPPRSVTSSRKSEPPTPIQTPVRSDYVLRSNRRPHQGYSSFGKTKNYHDWSSTDTDTRPTASTFNQSITKPTIDTNHDQKESSLRYEKKVELNREVLDSSANSVRLGLENSQEEQRDHRNDELVHLIESLRDSLERQNSRIRRLEIENSSLYNELKEMKRERQEQQSASQSSGTSPMLPPPVVLTTRLDESPQASFFPVPTKDRTVRDKTEVRHENERTCLNSVYQSAPSFHTLSPDPNQRFAPEYSRGTKTPNHTHYLPTHRYNRNDPIPNRRIARDMNDDVKEFQANVEYRIDGKNMYSPGTLFVEELSRVVEVPVGHYAPLSLIMDKHYHRLSGIGNDTTPIKNASFSHNNI
jgi:hypothetical protein